jgi:hypothetical protein
VRYCEGLPSLGTRPFTAEERALISRRRRRTWGFFAVRLGAGPALVVAGLTAAVALERAAGAGPAAPVAVLSLLLGLPAGLLWARDTLREARALGADLARGEAEQFGAGARALAVLPASALVLAGAGGSLSRRALVGEAAPPAEGAPAWAMPLSEIPERLQHLAWERRALLAAERAEIERRIAELRRPPILLAAVTALAGGGILGTVEEAERGPAAAAFRVVVWVALLALSWRRVLRARSLGARLEADARDGWVARATRGEAAGAEVLPASGLPWSEGGAPSPWRLAASAGRRWWHAR